MSTIRPKRPAVKVMRDGREVCDLDTAAGRREYEKRTLDLWRRGNGRCCLEHAAPMCYGRLLSVEATFEHEHGRGMGGGKRDDRITLPDGRWINGAAHPQCNAWKGSRYIPYNAEHNERLAVPRGGVATP
jgi:hypothetical protein